MTPHGFGFSAGKCKGPRQWEGQCISHHRLRWQKRAQTEPSRTPEFNASVPPAIAQAKPNDRQSGAMPASRLNAALAVAETGITARRKHLNLSIDLRTDSSGDRFGSLPCRPLERAATEHSAMVSNSVRKGLNEESNAFRFPACLPQTVDARARAAGAGGNIGGMHGTNVA